MNFAGPVFTCDGLECVPMTVMLFLIVLTPVLVGIAFSLLVAGFIFRKFINKKLRRPLSGRWEKLAITGLALVLFLLGLGIFYFPKSSYVKNYTFQKGVEQIGTSSIYLPNSITPDSVKVYVIKYGYFSDPSFKAKSTFPLNRGSLSIKENRFGAGYGFRKQGDKDVTCRSHKQTSYCYLDGPGYAKVQDLGMFSVVYERKELELDFNGVADPLAEVEALLGDGLSQKQIKDISNVSFTDNLFDVF